MAIEQVTSRPFTCAISAVEIYRLKTGPDYVVLITNLPSPTRVGGTLRITVQADRGLGPDWASKMFPGVELHLFDHTLPLSKVS